MATTTERAQRNRSATMLYLVSAAIGAACWIVTAGISGRNEAWDSQLYWTFAYPTALACSFGLGYWEPRRAWRWPLVIMLVQPVAMVAMTGVGNMLPLGLVFFAAMAVPGIALALFGAGLNRRFSWPRANRRASLQRPGDIPSDRKTDATSGEDK